MSSEESGYRAEEVAQFYLRLNGFLLIPGYILHRDWPDKAGTFHPGERAEIDFVGVRFPYSTEVSQRRPEDMLDDNSLVSLAEDGRILFILVEVKKGICSINGPLRRERREHANIDRIVRRLGFVKETGIKAMADTMYERMRWEGSREVLQFVAIGAKQNQGLQDDYPEICQITWKEMAGFLWQRFSMFGDIKRFDRPEFAKRFAGYFHEECGVTEVESVIHGYINGTA